MRFKRLAFLAAFLLLGVAAGASDAVESYRLSNQLPPSHHISKGMDLFAEKVKEYSKGEIEIKVLHSAQLFSDAEIVEALQNGLVELGVVPVNKWSGMIPAADIFEMPFVFADLSSP
ncbi:MAG TPA: C4-dicarboxylate ABC transporter substrate-binding protein, partial [Thermosynergistes sp.]|nr:C4-dicarboxylate ABC transporter substrate-binding protein [Thermosynergistes sp.]